MSMSASDKTYCIRWAVTFEAMGCSTRIYFLLDTREIEWGLRIPLKSLVFKGCDTWR